MSRPSQTESAYVQTIVRSKFFVRSSCVHRAFKSPHVQTFVRTKLPMSRLSCVPKEKSCAPKLIIFAFMSRLSCGQKTLCPDFRAFKIAYVQTFVRSKGKFVLQRNSKIDNLCVHVQTFVRSKIPMSRLLCVPYQKPSAVKLIFCGFMSSLSCFQKTLCRDFSAFKIAYDQTFECSKPKFAHQNLQLS